MVEERKRVSTFIFLILALCLFFTCKENPTDPEPTGNHTPEIMLITADPALINTLGTTILTCEAVDDDGDSLAYQWNSLDGSFPEGDSLASVSWRAPADTGSYTISVAISDGKESAKDSILIISDSIEVQVGFMALSGALSGTLTKNIYIVTGMVNVLSGESLKIEAGAVLKFDDDSGFNIDGDFTAVGTADDSILFELDEGASAWQGLNINSVSTDSCILNFCAIQGSNNSGIACCSNNVIISNCQISSNSSFSGGGINCYNCDPLISNCEITNNNAADNGGGIYCDNSSPSIEDCTISSNSAVHFGGGISCENQSTPMIVNSAFSDNTADVQGGAIYCYWNSDVSIDTCVINGNSARYGGGVFCMNSHPSMTRSVFYDNSSSDDGGAVFCNASNAIITNCTISGNSSSLDGGGIFSKNSSPALLNTIVEGNSGGGFYFENSSSASITFCDFSANSDSSFTGDPPVNLGLLTTVNANGDSTDAFSNIFNDPLFIDASSADYHLQWESPCIDAGDPASPTDPNGTTADVGAFYYNQ